MANKKAKGKSKGNNKNLIIGICCAVVVVVVIVVAIVLAVTSGNRLGDAYFVSDDTKYVLTVESDDMVIDEEEEAYAPVKTHLVYTYSGDEITGLKAYYEYADNASAKAAYDYILSSGEETGEVAIDGKYVIITAAPEEYEGLTASDVKQQVEFMEMMKNMDTSGAEEAGDVDGSGEEVITEEEADVVQE